MNYKYDQVIKMLLDCEETEFNEIRTRIQTVEKSEETENIHNKEIIMHGFNSNRLIEKDLITLDEYVKKLRKQRKSQPSFMKTTNLILTI